LASLIAITAVGNGCFVDMSFQAQGIAQQAKKSCAHLQSLQLPLLLYPAVMLRFESPPLADDDNNLHIMLW
jgi:hypothetical protein